jgi:hypothetical protein
MPESPSEYSAGDALRAIRKNYERRNEAKKDLTVALTNYLEELTCDPPAEPGSILKFAEIWGAYAVGLYEAEAERHFAGSPREPLALFGDSGELNGGVTVEEVKGTLHTLRVPHPQNWTALDFSREDDPLEMGSTMRKLAQSVATLPYSFSWLLGDEWFMGEIRKRVSEHAGHWREKFELREQELIDLSDETPTERGRIRSEWITKQLTGRPYKHISDHPDGPARNTLKRYRSGKASNQDSSVRGQIAKVFGCNVSEVPL